MTVDATKPTDKEVLSTHAAYIRAIAAALNAASVDAGAAVITVAMTAGQTNVDLNAIIIEIVMMSSATAEDLERLQGTDSNVTGYMKILRFADSNITVKHGSDNILLNGDADLDAEINDVIGLIYDGSNWNEAFRSLNV